MKLDAPRNSTPQTSHSGFGLGCLCVVLLGLLLSSPASGGLTILTPYSQLDWSSYGQYKGNLHTHTTQSDGQESPAVMIDAYHALGYSILAIADHNTVTWPWTDYGRNPADLGMVAIQASEPSRHHHIGSYFSDFASSGDIDTSLTTIGEKNGLAVMFHPGRYNWSVSDYVAIYQRYDHLVGMEVYNQGDRYPGDRALWDQVLTQLGPDRPVWGYSNDDAHRLSHVGRNWQTFILPELNEDAVRTAMVEGHFYFSYAPQPGDAAPIINNVAIDEQAGTIFIDASGYDTIRWISRGMMLDAQSSTLEVAGVQGYVRAELTGPTGKTYTQPFYLLGVDDDDNGPALPALIAADSFWTTADGAGGTYAAFPTQLVGQNPSASSQGFSSGWINSTNDVRATADTNLEHALVVNPTDTAGALETRDGGRFDRGVYRRIDAIPDSEHYFMSFLMESPGGARGFLGLRTLGNQDSSVTDTNGVSVGFFDDRILAVVNGRMVTIVDGFDLGETYFTFVEILNHGSGMADLVTFKLFASQNADPDSPDHVLTIDDQNVTGMLTHLAFVKHGEPVSSAFFDEFRFGTSKVAVIIPEPASLALLGLGGLVMFSRRRG